MRSRFGITAKINLLIASVLVTVFLSFNILLQTVYEQRRKMSIEELVMTISRLRSAHFLEHIGKAEYQIVAEEIRKDISMIPDLLEADVFNRRGDKLLGKSADGQGTARDEWIVGGIEKREMLHLWEGAVFRHFEPIRRGRDIEGFLHLRYDASFIADEIEAERNKFLAVSGLLTMISMAAGLVLSRRLTRPIKELTRASRKVAEGDLSVEVPSRTGDELSILASNFNRMVKMIERNIDERRLAEETARKSEERYRDLVEKMRDIIFTLDGEGRITSVNSAVRRYGFEPGELIGRSFIDLVPEGRRGKMLRGFQDVLMRDEAVTDVMFLDKEGNPHFFEVSSTAISGGGIAAGARGIMRDVTERRKAEKFIENILESVGEGFIVISPDYRILSANRAYSEQVKMPVKDIIGRHCHEVSHHRDVPCWLAGEDCPARYTFETGLPSQVVHRHLDSEGHDHYLEVKSFPMRDETGRINAAIELTNDITERVRLEEQLRQAQKMEAVGQLAGGVAHDFNNILSAIMGYGNIVLMKLTEGDPLRSHVNHVLEASERAAQLTHSLLAFSRQQIMLPRPVDVNEIIASVAKFLRRIIGEDIELYILPGDRPLTVMADQGQVEQVLMNLCANARDAMPGGGSLTIESASAVIEEGGLGDLGPAEPGSYALLSVTDSGLGMDERTRKRIFEPFFTTKEAGKGTGLGLSMAYGIIKQHNGYMSVYSEPGKGSTFKTYLPLTKDASQASAKTKEPEELRGGSETILIAEDDEALRKMTSAVVREFGYAVVEASDGNDAIARFLERSDEVRLAILDVVMPRRNGKEVYEEMLRVRGDVKAIFVSGYTANIIHKKGILDEGLDFIMKPFSPRDLLLKIREVLDR